MDQDTARDLVTILLAHGRVPSSGSVLNDVEQEMAIHQMLSYLPDECFVDDAYLEAGTLLCFLRMCKAASESSEDTKGEEMFIQEMMNLLSRRENVVQTLVHSLQEKMRLHPQDTFSEGSVRHALALCDEARQRANNAINGQHVEKSPGTETWMESCPECNTKKRMDRNSKHFRCTCGFKSRYLPHETGDARFADRQTAHN